MATPMTPAEWRAALKKWDVPFREIGDFAKATSGRDDETGLTFGPVNGGMQHHVGDDGPDDSSRRLIDQGRTGLPGPLAQAGLNDDGVIDLFTWKRANHAGGGDPAVLRAVIAENYGLRPPETHEHQGSAGAVDGNDRFYGLEAYYFKNLTQAAYRSMCRFWAAVCDHHDWTAKSVIGHEEWSDWKIDPNLIDMPDMRADIQKLLDEGPGGSEGPVEKVLLPTNIRRSLKANWEYQRALEKIGANKAQDEVEIIKRELVRQRRMLRNFKVKRS